MSARPTHAGLFELRYLCLFSGISAASVAWRPLGWECAGYAEIDPHACAVLAHHYPNVRNFGDVRNINHEEIGPVDVVIFGSPCQSFSIAGKRLGLDDARGQLALHAIRLVGQVRPKWFIFENVPGLLSSDGGKDFGAFLAAVGECGYQCAWRIVDAQYFGVPQRRRRLFVVGCLGDWRGAAAVLFERDCLSGNPAPRRKAREGIAGTIAPGSRRGDRSGSESGSMIVANGEVSGTLTSNTGGLTRPAGNANELDFLIASSGDISHCLNAGGMGRQDYEIETMIVHTSPPLTTNPYGDNESRDGILVPVAYQCQGTNVGEMGTLRAGNGNETGGVPFIAFDSKASGRNGFAAGDVSPTLRAMGSNNGRANAGGQVAIAVGIDGSDTAFALRANPSHSGDKGDGGVNATLVAGTVGHGVRRLTPVECERLQGFPDNYTRIAQSKSWRLLDETETVEELRTIGLKVRQRKRDGAWQVCDPDGARYKMLGNSMAVPVIKWLGRRIELAEGIMQNAIAQRMAGC